MAKSNFGEERAYLPNASILLLIIEGSQDKNSNRAGTRRQELVQRPQRSTTYWLVLHGLLRVLFYRTQDHQPRSGTTHNKLGPPTPSTNYNFPIGLPTTKSYRSIFSIEAPSSMMNLVCVSVT